MGNRSTQESFETHRINARNVFKEHICHIICAINREEQCEHVSVYYKTKTRICSFANVSSVTHGKRLKRKLVIKFLENMLINKILKFTNPNRSRLLLCTLQCASGFDEISGKTTDVYLSSYF